MPGGDFESFRRELKSIRGVVTRISQKTVRDDELRERILTLCRGWIASLRPRLLAQNQSRQDILKLGAEIEALAVLTSKVKPTRDYRKRLGRAVALSDSIVLTLPPSAQGHKKETGPRSERLFLEEIPDLPGRLVPNALLGWREQMMTFLASYPFDRSVFLMIRYRTRNNTLITSLKRHAKKHGFNLILASDHRLTDDLYNPVACLLCCARGLAIFDEPESDQAFNPNVAYELGMMHLLGRECRVLKHTRLKALHTDILMKLYCPYGDETAALEHLDQWLGVAD